MNTDWPITRSRSRMSLHLITTVLTVAWFSILISHAAAQGTGAEPSLDLQLDSELDLGPQDLPPDTNGNNADFTSRPVGKRQRWQLDTGYFDFDDRQSGLLPENDTSGDYSGIRLRRPRKN